MSDQPNSPSGSGLYGTDPAAPAGTAPSLLDQVAGVFTEPSALFQKLRSRPVWLPALALAVAIVLVAMLVWASKVDMAEVTRLQMEATREIFKMNIPDQVMDDAISKAEGKQPWISSVLTPLLVTPVFYLIMALIVWAFAAMGKSEEDGTPSFIQALSVTSVHNLVTLPAMLLALVMCFLQTVGGRNIQQMAPTVLSFFVRPESVLLRGLTALADPLWIFSFVVLGIGMKQTLRTKTWAIVACLGFFAFFGGLFRFLGGVMS